MSLKIVHAGGCTGSQSGDSCFIFDNDQFWLFVADIGHTTMPLPNAFDSSQGEKILFSKIIILVTHDHFDHQRYKPHKKDDPKTGINATFDRTAKDAKTEEDKVKAEEKAAKEIADHLTNAVNTHIAADAEINIYLPVNSNSAGATTEFFFELNGRECNVRIPKYNSNFRALDESAILFETNPITPNVEQVASMQSVAPDTQRLKRKTRANPGNKSKTIVPAITKSAIQECLKANTKACVTIDIFTPQYDPTANDENFYSSGYLLIAKANDIPDDFRKWAFLSLGDMISKSKKPNSKRNEILNTFNTLDKALESLSKGTINLLKLAHHGCNENFTFIEKKYITESTQFISSGWSGRSVKDCIDYIKNDLGQKEPKIQYLFRVQSGQTMPDSVITGFAAPICEEGDKWNYSYRGMYDADISIPPLAGIKSVENTDKKRIHDSSVREQGDVKKRQTTDSLNDSEVDQPEMDTK